MLNDIEKKKVLLCLPCASSFVPSCMVESLMQIFKPCQVYFSIINRQKIDWARNNFVKEAIAGNYDYIFFVDDDNPVPHDTLLKMLHADKDIVGAPIISRTAPYNGNHVLCAFYREQLNDISEDVSIYKPIEKFNDSGSLHRVDAIGTGCLLIKRKVFETVYDQYKGNPFEFTRIQLSRPIIYEGKEIFSIEYGEDVAFSMRAASLGFQIWLDDSIRPYHLGENERFTWSPSVS